MLLKYSSSKLGLNDFLHYYFLNYCYYNMIFMYLFISNTWNVLFVFVLVLAFAFVIYYIYYSYIINNY